MKTISHYVSLSLLLLLIAGFFTFVLAAEKNTRTFMFIGEPNAKAWQYMIDNPEDRKKEVASGMAALGGKIVSYYFGLGNGKNYIIVELPNDNELIQAIYLMRLPAGLLNSYQIIELMPSDQMSNALKRSKSFIEKDTTVKK